MAVIFGIAILKNKLISKWIGGAGVVIGAVTIYAGLEVSYQGFGGLTTEIGISMIIYFIWVGIMGGSMWKKSMSMLKTSERFRNYVFPINSYKRNQNKDVDEILIVQFPFEY